ncbi:hypothetical protein VKT23_014256 [Stygiomarasmius scandens]
MRERGNQTMLEEMIVEATKTKLDLQEKADRLKLIQQEISTLYENVFGGPTAEFPRDDQLESQLKSAQETYDAIQAHLNSESQAVNLLNKANGLMQACMNYMNEALSYSTWDIYGGGTLSDMMERNALSNAAMTASKAELLIHQAQRASPQVQPIPPLRVHEISMIGDVFFDNVFSDIAAHSKIERNKNELEQAHKRLKAELRAVKARAQQTGADLLEASEVLSDCRKELERFRRETFERVGGISSAPMNSNISRAPVGASTDSLPPSYETSATGTPLGGPGVIYSPPSGPPPGAEEAPIYQPPPGPPPGPSREPGQSQSVTMPIPSLSSISSSSTGAQGPIYLPPPGPPPSHQSLSPQQPSSSLKLPMPSSPSRAQSRTHAKSPSVGSNKDLPALPSGVPEGSDNSSRPVSPSSPSRVPAHWGSRNPFAASMMNEHYDHSRYGSENNAQ